jgi:hypothetical protein
MTPLKSNDRGFAEAPHRGRYVLGERYALTLFECGSMSDNLKKDDREKGRGMRPAPKESDCF